MSGKTNFKIQNSKKESTASASKSAKAAEKSKESASKSAKTAEKSKESSSKSAKAAEKSKESTLPYVRIVEQPRSRGLRFRYQCEGRRAGIIEGENSIPVKKTYPTIELVNSPGPAFVVVSCVTKDFPYRPHPHSIDGKGKEFSHGICYMKVPAGQNTIVFPRLTIQCIKKVEVANALEERKRLKVNPFMTEYPNGHQSVDMSCVRLCFQVFLEGKQPGNFNVPLKPIVTQPIYDKKTSVEFEIKWISHHSASVAGGKVICIISEKMVKDDIQVVFFCEKKGWEATAEFTYPFFHKQVAVVLKTPAYLDQEVSEIVDVQVMLRRPSNNVTSLPVPFQLLPVDSTIRDSQRTKRLRLCMNPRVARTILEQHMLKEAANNAAKKVSQAQHSDTMNQQSMKAEESKLPKPQREFLNQFNLQMRPPAPQTPVEFKQLLDNYLYGDRRDFTS